jgi:hypothetical protein
LGGRRRVGEASTTETASREGKALASPPRKGIGMRVRFWASLTALVPVLVLLGLPLADAGAHPATPVAAAKVATTVSPAQVSATIYGQLDNDNGVAVVSQHFDTKFLKYDSHAADDFKIRTKAVIKQIEVDGVYFSGTGPANNVHVTIYKDASGALGPVVQDVPHAPYSDPSGTGSFLVQVPNFRLRPGSYWLSVYVNMPFRLGEWGWSTNNLLRHHPSLWQNPGNGFASGCTAWEKTTSCIMSGEGPDFAFALLGKSL